jgi:hypothetical protein
MNAEIFAEWMQRQGHRVIHTESSYWYDAGPHVYQAFPFHWLIMPSDRELRKFMIKYGALAVRYSKPVDASEGIVSYHAVLNGPYELQMLRHQARNGIRHGLKHFQIERIPFKRLAEEGWYLQQDTLDRQDRTSSMSQAEWQRICLAAEGLPGFEAWGAISNGELAGSLLTVRIDNTWYVPYAQSRREFLNKHVNNALFYTVCCEMLSREGIAGMFFCLHSLDAPPSVDEFKWRMGFIAKPVRQQVEFHPWLNPFISPHSHSLILRMLKRFPGNHLLSKAEGLLRFSLQGKKPINQQEWPECLNEYQAKREQIQILESEKENTDELVDVNWAT